MTQCFGGNLSPDLFKLHIGVLMIIAQAKSFL